MGELNECCVCLEKCHHLTNCKHSLCRRCYDLLPNHYCLKGKACPMCRKLGIKLKLLDPAKRSRSQKQFKRIYMNSTFVKKLNSMLLHKICNYNNRNRFSGFLEVYTLHTRCNKKRIFVDEIFDCNRKQLLVFYGLNYEIIYNASTNTLHYLRICIEHCIFSNEYFLNLRKYLKSNYFYTYDPFQYEWARY
jgi:hypothetical protein